MPEQTEPTGAESPRERANRAQLDASDPAVSVFVAASAGSGKTKLLTDRLLRLMLAGAKPERIQCLTFTKAAAAEMALRLQRTLGRWVTLPQDELAKELASLRIEPTDETCRKARALFAQVLDLPGGMRIGTIHAFSQSLLRRFPLEASISPHFQLVDERDAKDALTEARESMLAGANTPALQEALSLLAGLTSADQFGQHVATLESDRDRLARALALGPDLQAAQRRALGVTAAGESEIIAEAMHWSSERALREAALQVQAKGSPSVAERASQILDWLGLTEEDRKQHWDAWRTLFFSKSGPRARSAFLNPKLAATDPELAAPFLAEIERTEAVEDSCRAVRLAAISAALVTLATPVLASYAAHKAQAGLLDYEDLIGRTSALLVDPGAAWVLYKLDGGLDHLLLDEVQDTAPEQWRIAHALTAEFFSGAGARDTPRSVFAVGDRKQSIYSFQGADAEEFTRSRGLLARRVQDAGEPWLETGLDVSFRSTRPVLALVDAVFADPTAAAGVVAPGEALAHYADRGGHAGAVELWPLAPRPDPLAPLPWTVPERNQGLTSAPQRLADALARWIRNQTDGSVVLESKGRPLAAGDVMVLVRRRQGFASALVRALKAQGVPVAGLDRLVLTEQPAVQDLMALADSLLMPQDDLTFACVLTSPLGGLDDGDLMDLAMDRPGPLWEALRDRATEKPAWQQAWNFFSTLLARVDYVTPYALLAEALGSLGGRARLLARLGPEAAEPVDELLNAALDYVRIHPPSLQGFLHWFRRSAAEVKREPEGAGNSVRVMTVHGAKGLQAPLVILPDTTALPPDNDSILWMPDPATGTEVPLWAGNVAHRCAKVVHLREAIRRRKMEEHNRLLYVALTRAEDRLLVCGWQGRNDPPEDCWYEAVRRGFAAVPAERSAFAEWDGEVQRFRTEQRALPEVGKVSLQASAEAGLPPWIGRAPDWRTAPPAPEPARPRPLAPSRPEGVELGPVPPSASPLVRQGAGGRGLFRGEVVHALLEHLPALPAAEWPAAARRYLERSGSGNGETGGLTAPEIEVTIQEVLGVLRHPDLAPLFGPEGRAEVPLTGVVGHAVIGGVVDRLAVLPDSVLVADFKTNRRPPARVIDTPVLYLRQMASYRAVLRIIFPDRPVRCALVWTAGMQVAVLPDALLDKHDPSHEVAAA